MGWRDREYARWTDAERRRFLGSGDSGSSGRSYATNPRQGSLFRSSSRVRLLPGVFLAVIGSLVVALALGQLPHSHPIIPSLNFTLPGSGNNLGHQANGTISLPTGVAVGSFLTLHGDLPPGETGTVTVEGAYDRGAWRVLASVPVADHSYEARFPVSQPGQLQIRVTYPDGHQSVGETQVG